MTESKVQSLLRRQEIVVPLLLVLQTFSLATLVFWLRAPQETNSLGTLQSKVQKLEHLLGDQTEGQKETHESRDSKSLKAFRKSVNRIAKRLEALEEKQDELLEKNRRETIEATESDTTETLLRLELLLNGFKQQFAALQEHVIESNSNPKPDAKEDLAKTIDRSLNNMELRLARVEGRLEGALLRPQDHSDELSALQQTLQALVELQRRRVNVSNSAEGAPELPSVDGGATSLPPSEGVSTASSVPPPIETKQVVEDSNANASSESDTTQPTDGLTKKSSNPHVGEERLLTPTEIIGKRKQRQELLNTTLAQVENESWSEALPIASQLVALDNQIYSSAPGKLNQSYRLLAQIHARLENLTEAMATLESLHEILNERRDEWAQQLEEIDKEVRSFRELSQLSLEDRRRLSEADVQSKRVNDLFVDQEFDEALKIANTVLETRRDILGKSHLAVAGAYNNLASVQFRLGDLNKAEEQFREALRIRRDLKASPDQIRTSRTNLEDTLIALANRSLGEGDLAAAAKNWSEVAQLRAATYGEEAWQVVDASLEANRIQFNIDINQEDREKLIAAINLADEVTSQFNQSNFKSAIEPAQQVLQLRIEVLGKSHVEIGDSLLNLALLHDRANNREESEKSLNEALAIYQSVLSSSNPRFATYLVQIIDMNLTCLAADDVAEQLDRAAQIFLNAYGESSEEYLDVRRRQTEIRQSRLDGLEEKGRIRDAILLAEELTATLEEQYGEGHWKTIDGGRRVEYLKLFQSLKSDEQKVLREANTKYRSAMALMGNDLAEAKLDAQSALNLRQKILGRSSTLVAESEFLLARIEALLGNDENAKSLYLRVAELRQESLGDRHPDTANALNNLAELYRKLGEYEKAEPLYRQALKVTENYCDPGASDLATSLNNLALFFHNTGKLGEALPLYQQALGIAEANLERYPSDYAQSLNNLAGVYSEMGDYAQAEPLYLAAIDIRKKVSGGPTLAYAVSLNNLGLLYFSEKQFDAAESMFREALGAVEKIVDASAEKRQTHATSLSNLASLMHETARFDEAGRYFRLVLELLAKNGEDNAAYALALANLASHNRATGNFQAAHEQYARALELVKTKLGKNHELYTKLLMNKARLWESEEQLSEALPLIEEAVSLARKRVEQLSHIQSERQQLATVANFRSVLDRYLTLAFATEVPVAKLYDQVLGWKGAVFARQLRLRELRAAMAEQDRDSEILISELDSISCQIAAKVFDNSLTIDKTRQLDELTRRKEQLEIQLAERSGKLEVSRDGRLDTKAIATLLPPQMVLVDTIRYSHAIRPKDGKGQWRSENRFVAFALRRDGNPAVVELGRADLIDQAVALWRATTKRSHPVMDDNDPALALRNLVWLPIEKQLADDSVLLFSPDASLCKLPLSALPGETENTYLLEERAIGILPIPQLLPELLSKRTELGKPSMFLVGDVDYDRANAQASNTKAKRAGVLGEWKSLPETRTEIVTIGDSFSLTYPDAEQIQLRRDKASENRFRELAADFRWLHLATHGFFAKHDMFNDSAARQQESVATTRKSLVAGAGLSAIHPGALSGIVLSGANFRSGDGKNDGMLTALEVAEMDLSKVEVVVLSACETGLGEVAGGEGVLGIQRAFQLAGASTVITSLWTVDDLATQLLMVRFYDQLWASEGGSAVGKLEAFRQAQLTLLREGPKRGFAAEEEPERSDLPPRTPPFYWAAFSISGDWN